MEDLEVTGMRVKREPCPKERGAPVVVGKALKLARRMRISILRYGFLFVFTVTGSPGVGRFAADEVGGDDNVDEQEHCEWGILLEEASWKNPCFNLFSFCSNLGHSREQLNLIIQGFSFFAPFPHQLCVREISCETKSSSQGGTILRWLTDLQ